MIQGTYLVSRPFYILLLLLLFLLNVLPLFLIFIADPRHISDTTIIRTKVHQSMPFVTTVSDIIIESHWTLNKASLLTHCLKHVPCDSCLQKKESLFGPQNKNFHNVNMH